MDGNANVQRRVNRRAVIKGLGLTGLAVAGGATLAACGSDGTTTRASNGGPLSGTISFANYEGWIGPNTIKGFQKAHPGVTIHEVTDAASFRSMLPKLKVQPDLYDMALGSIDSIGRAIRMGVLAELDFAAIPNLKNVDPKFVNVSVNSDGKYFVPTDYGKVGIGVRTDLVDDEITSWADLWRLAPKYADKLFVYDHDKDLLGTALLSIGQQVNDQSQTNVEAAGRALQQLKPSIGTLGTSGIGSSLVSGDAAIAITYDYEIFAAQQKNDKIQWISPAEGMTGYLEGWVAMAGTRRLNVVQAFTDYHLASENYAAFVKATDTAYVEKGLARLLPHALSTSPILFPPKDVLEKVTFEEYLGVAEPFYDQAYTEFKAA